MGILYEKVQLTKELKRQMMIRQLIDMGITEYKGRSIYDLGYYTLRYVLAMEKFIREMDDVKSLLDESQN
ncbi:hypothetical protein P4S93_07380 [Aneurinibacillus thermoaerophilus]|uniref:Fur-regulated basic protein A n=1 Tax=Aneurinibacillus thermoaerophilus TaxID=143495 RepID=A0A1G8APA3_ANETH|nr:hypothetical protein [Aneurinibacillus thermoaerophilus]MED0758755.1 hypothetical protein [Aneurinibacillus thermoaerophilus]MED0760593.1 hypothetical protein [Aneurinibacillus thermoaerophilus]SDH22831.1 hypothetical protein SAMN04489735_101731 [Aneurinibacillus thermoaerophilus]